MKDFRGLGDTEFRATFLGETLLSQAASWRETLFTWKRWDRYRPDWTHDHCLFCFACICNHRDRFPELNPGDRGCYRHAYYAEREDGTYLWVCRNCFKRFQKDFDWARTGSRQGPRNNAD